MYTQKSEFLREIMDKERRALEDFQQEFYQVQPEDIAVQQQKMARRASKHQTETAKKLAAMKTALRAGDTDALKLSKELWGNSNPSYDQQSQIVSSNREAMESVYDPANLDGVHTIKGEWRNATLAHTLRLCLLASPAPARPGGGVG